MRYVVLFGDDGSVRALEFSAFLRRSTFPELADSGADVLRLTLDRDALGLRVAEVTEFRLLFDAAGRQDPARLASAQAAYARLGTVERMLLEMLPTDSLDAGQRHALQACRELDTEDYVRALVLAVGEQHLAAELDDLEALDDAFDALAEVPSDEPGELDARRAELVDIVFDLFYRPEVGALRTSAPQPS